jgi:cell division protein FtsW
MIEERNSRPTIEVTLIACIILLIGIGFGFLYSASSPAGDKYFNNSYYYIIRQAIYLCAGLFFFMIGFFLDHQIYNKYIKYIVIGTIVILVITLIPGIGKEVSGARRWISFFGFQFQPSELAKLTLIFYLSSVLANKEELIEDFYKGVLPPLLLTGFLTFLIFIEKSFSTTFLIFFIVVLMFFLGGIRLITFGMLLLVGGLSSVVMIFFAPYRVSRFFAFLNQWEDPLGAGWHYIQSMKCFTLGKWFGRGIGESIQKNYALPEAHNDYIYAIIAEEGGVFIAIIIIVLYTIAAFVGFNIAKKTDNKYSYLMACGITSLIYVQAMMNIGVVIGVLPSTGVTLPFVSSGGTSLVMFMFAVGVLLNISRFNKHNEKRYI